MLQEEEDFVTRLGPSVWRKWAPIIIGYPLSGDAEAKEQHSTLVRMAYAAAPKETIESLMILIDRENRDLQSVWILENIKHCWDEHPAKALLSTVKETQ